ncbi:MAG: fused MFS/spermidine synthase [Alphaproteobacteria bacterium]
MTIQNHAIPRAAPLRVAPALFAATLFASALLLFAVQPMFTKMVLPMLGGAPAVWSVAMVFFQAALLIGYAYAHLLARTLTVGQSALAHLGVLGVAALTLPIGVAQGFDAPPSTGIGLWLVGLFAASIGLPFAALSANAPLLQSWFAASGHPQARNPYVLYAASNLGSFAALLAYPLALESLLTLRMQAWVWSIGFAALVILIAVCAVAGAAGHGMTPAHAEPVAKPTWRDRAVWAALAAIPAGLVIAVTAHISTDIAAAPLLWVLPLALYLLTFVAVFRERPWFSHGLVVKIVPFVVAPLAITLLGGDREYWLASIALNLLAMFVLGLACHGEVYARRPAPALLTEFYLWTSFGGVIGGIFAGLAAPHLFNTTYEYPILVTAALLALPGALHGPVRDFLWRISPAIAVALLAGFLYAVIGFRVPGGLGLTLQVVLVTLVGLMLLQRRDPARFAALAVCAFIITGLWQPGLRLIEQTRSFFGVHRVVEKIIGTHRMLVHGNTIHGAERVREADGAPVAGRPEPLTYYYFGGPISEVTAAARAAAGTLKNVAVVGLGAGSMACHRKDGETWTFFEIDPEVVRLARDPNIFRFLSSCAPDTPVVLGDARLTLAASPQQFDLIVLDAFSSDAIPTHLLTREALRGYLAHLSPHGMLLIHISNRHLELAKVVAAMGATEGLVTLVKTDRNDIDFTTDLRAAAQVAVLARNEADFGSLLGAGGWEKAEAGAVAPWSDDYSDIIGAMLRKKLGR